MGKGAWEPGSPSPPFMHGSPAPPGTCLPPDGMMVVADLEDESEANHVKALPTHLTDNERKEVIHKAAKDGKRRLSAAVANEAGLFVDEQSLKEQIRVGMLMKPQPTVEELYKTDGWAQKVARHHMFEKSTLSVVIINAGWMAIDTDLNHEPLLYDSHPVFVIAENLFCIYFFVELLIRFAAFAVKLDCFKDKWFQFDLVLVVFMVLETWCLAPIVFYMAQQSGGGSGPSLELLTPLKLLRLLRMARMAKLMRAMPELLILIKAIAIATRTVFYTFFLLGLIIYVFAIFFTTQLGRDSELADHDDCKFGTVQDSITTLLIASAFPDLQGVLLALKDNNIALFLAFILFVLIAALTIMNMLIGILCEIISCISSAEKEELQVGQLKTDLLTLLENGIDKDYDALISKEEFLDLLMKPEACKAMAAVGVDVVGLVDCIDFIFLDDENLSFPDFMNIILELRGSNVATVKDMVDQRKWYLAQEQNMRSWFEETLQKYPSLPALGGGLPHKHGEHSMAASAKALESSKKNCVLEEDEV